MTKSTDLQESISQTLADPKVKKAAERVTEHLRDPEGHEEPQAVVLCATWRKVLGSLQP